MPDFLRINGIIVPVADGSPSIEQVFIGETRRAVDGSPIINRRAIKGVWKFRTATRTALEAIAFRRLIAGEGHLVTWDGNHHYSTKGLPPTSVGADFTTTQTNVKFGAGPDGISPFRANSAATATNKAAWQMFATSGAVWTISMHVSTNAGVTWAHYVVDSSARKWVDGVRNDAASTTFLAVASGLVTIGVTSTAYAFDDVVGLPYLVPTDWPAQISASIYPWGRSPRVTASGLFIEQDTQKSVVASPSSGRVTQGFYPTFDRSLHDFEFELLEV